MPGKLKIAVLYEPSDNVTPPERERRRRREKRAPIRGHKRDRRAKRDHLLRPLMIVAQVVVEERDVVVRQSGGEAEGYKARADNPGTVEPT